MLVFIIDIFEKKTFKRIDFYVNIGKNISLFLGEGFPSGQRDQTVNLTA